jgi:glycosyltransferase involved in cell wall biosynthesis
MKIGIYSQPSGPVLGGTDVAVAVLAEALADSHAVEVLHHAERLSAEQLGAFSGTDLSRVTLRRVSRTSRPDHEPLNPYSRLRGERRREAEISEGYDLFIPFTHEPPPFCHARYGLISVLFPTSSPLHRDGRTPTTLWGAARRMYSALEWSRRLGSYQGSVAISNYTREWTRRRWGVDSAVVYPPTESPGRSAEKEPLILSIGRFAAKGFVKCQAELVHTFKRLPARGWRYVSAGAVATVPADQAYLAAVQDSAGPRTDIQIAGNVPRSRVRELYAQASIFWHAAGWTNAINDPSFNEHFGISTVEAMSYGAVPVVINRGGQPEIVEHGISGFVWNDERELVEYTLALMDDSNLLHRMSEAARQRAQHFRRPQYVNRFRQVIDDLMNGTLNASSGEAA